MNTTSDILHFAHTMGDANSPSERLPQIKNREEHDSIVSRENQERNIPVVIYVTSSTPASRALTPSIIALSKKQEFVEAGVQWYEMELTSETSPMIKFGPQNCPIVFLFRGTWCETLLGVRGSEDVEKKAREMVERR